MQLERLNIFRRFFRPLRWTDGSQASLLLDDKFSAGLLLLSLAMSLGWAVFAWGREFSEIEWWMGFLLVSIPPGLLSRLRMCVVLELAEEAERNGESYPRWSLFRNSLERDATKYEESARDLLRRAQEEENSGDLRKAARHRKLAAKRQASAAKVRKFVDEQHE